MKIILLTLIIVLLTPCAADSASSRRNKVDFMEGQYIPGQVYVRTYQKRNGTVVEGHRRTRQNRTTYDNWSTIGNVNPWTGKRGTKRP